MEVMRLRRSLALIHLVLIALLLTFSSLVWSHRELRYEWSFDIGASNLVQLSEHRLGFPFPIIVVCYSAITPEGGDYPFLHLSWLAFLLDFCFFFSALLFLIGLGKLILHIFWRTPKKSTELDIQE